MDKVLISSRINRLTGGTELLFCTRVYINVRIYGSFWIPLEFVLNKSFYLIRGEKNHVRASYLYERKVNRGARTKAEDNQVTAQEASES